MIQNLLKAISDRLPCKVIKDNGRPYLERYYIGTLFGVRYYLHRFVASDPDRGMHDHPWRWALSIILAGWYWQQTRYGMGKVRWFNWITGDTFHRVILHEQREPYDYESTPRHVWTLFMHRAARDKEWGFLYAAPEAPNLLYRPHAPSADDAWWKAALPGRFTDGRMR